MRPGVARKPSISARRSTPGSMRRRSTSCTSPGNDETDLSLESDSCVIILSDGETLHYLPPTPPAARAAPPFPFRGVPSMSSRILSIAALAFGLTLATGSLAQAVFRVSAIPDEAPTELQRKFAPLGKYLEQRIGMPVQFTPVSDYAAVVQSLATGRIDMAWLGGFTYVQAKDVTHGAVIPLVQREEDQRFTSRFITAN